jgi:hypothetical protein
MGKHMRHLKISVFSVAALAVAGVLLAASAARAQAIASVLGGPGFDFTGDYANDGANGWTYGYYAGGSLAGAFTPFTDFEVTVPGSGSWWLSSSPLGPAVSYDDTANAMYFGSQGIVEPSYTAVLGPAYGPVAVRFTVPQGAVGNYDITGTFQTVQTVNYCPTAYIYVGGTQVYDSQPLSDPGNAQFGVPSSYVATLFLSAGETVDFVVGSDGWKSTALAASVTPVPEPATGSILLIGGMGLLMRRPRKQAA